MRPYSMSRTRTVSSLLLLPSLLLSCAAVQEQEQKPQFRDLHVEGEPYRTPRSGEAFRTEAFGREIEVPERDRTSVSAWDLGFAGTAPGPSGSQILPFGAIYLWRNNAERLLRATLVGIFNDVYYARTIGEPRPGQSGMEWVFTFENFTAPFARPEIIDGEVIDEEALVHGHVRGGVGLGIRKRRGPAQDNMVSASLTLEPGFIYFDEGPDTVDSFVVPSDTFETRLHQQVRLDALERNLLELPHAGHAFGSDLVGGYRSEWDDWGTNGSESGGEDRSFGFATAYGWLAGGVPFVRGERQRMVGSLHGGLGGDLDRFSAPRIGGGPQGEDHGALSRPVLPGAVINEFTPEHYAIAIAEYRYEPIFFSYFSLRGSLGWLDRDRADSPDREDDWFTSIGARITTGFLFEMRLQLDYNYSADVIRDGDLGGHEVVFHLSRSLTRIPSARVRALQ